MTLKDIYRTIIRLFAIFLFFTTMSGLIAQLPNTIYYVDEPGVIFSLIGGFLLLIGIFLGVIFRTDGIVNFLKLYRHQTTDKIIINNLTELNIIKTSILIISLYFFMSNVPHFIFESIAYFGHTPEASEGVVGLLDEFMIIPFNLYNWTTALFYVVISYLLFSNYNLVSNFLNKRVVEKKDAIDDGL